MLGSRTGPYRRTGGPVLTPDRARTALARTAGPPVRYGPCRALAAPRYTQPLPACASMQAAIAGDPRSTISCGLVCSSAGPVFRTRQSDATPLPSQWYYYRPVGNRSRTWLPKYHVGVCSRAKIDELSRVRQLLTVFELPCSVN